jgi:hypothetical protein
MYNKIVLPFKVGEVLYYLNNYGLKTGIVEKIRVDIRKEMTTTLIYFENEDTVLQEFCFGSIERMIDFVNNQYEELKK